MMNCKYIVIDNELSQVHRARKLLLELGVPADHIWPSTDDLATIGWLTVEPTLHRIKSAGWDPAANRIVLLIDIALDENDEQTPLGFTKIKGALSFYQQYILVAYTKSSDDAELLKGQIYDGVLSKRKLSELETSKAAAYLGDVVRTAALEFSNRVDFATIPAVAAFCRIEQDINFRLLCAEFGNSILPRLVTAVTQSDDGLRAARSVPEASILTGGYSGTFVILLHYATADGNSRDVVLKLGREKAALDRESENLLEVNRSLHKWGELLPVAYVREARELTGKAGVWFLELNYFKAKTFESMCLDGQYKASQKLADITVNRLAELVKFGIAEKKAKRLSDKLSLSEDDIARLRTTASKVNLLLNSGDEQGNLMRDHFKVAGQNLAGLVERTASWSTYVLTIADRVPFYEQHGDLNPRNLLVSAKSGAAPELSRTQLIDFARFGMWPLCYDLVRFHLQLALRLLDPPDLMRDYFPARVMLWDHAWADSLKESTQSDKDAAGEFKLFVRLGCAITKVIKETLQPFPEDERSTLGRVIKILYCYELIKMASYQDTSWFKRTWFLLLASKYDHSITQKPKSSKK